jgi:PmbA protein
MAFAHSNDLGEGSLNKAIQSAVNFAARMTADKNNLLPEDKGVSRVKGLYDPDLSKVPMDKKIALAMKVEKMAQKDKRITKSAGSGYSEGERQTFLANSNGLNKSYPSTYCSYGVSVVAEKGEQKCSGGEYCTRRYFSKLLPIEKIAAKAAKDAYQMLDPKMIKTQRAAVIFDPDVAYSLLGGILRAIHGERVLQGASFLRNSLNKQVASKLITIIDDGLMAGGLGSQPFDGEGVPTQKRVIIDQGVLKGFMYNTISAKRAGAKSTGNASRRGYNGLPGIGSHNFYVTAGPHTPEEIIKKTGKGLLLKGVTGYGINPVNGNFSGGASGFWIENGKIAFPVKGITIAGSAKSILMGIDMKGNDLDLNRRMAAPTLRVKELQIGGE